MIIDSLLTVSSTPIDWAQFQLALTAIYNWLFLPLTLGLGVIMAVITTIHYRKGDDVWGQTARFWQKLFAINYVITIAAGIIIGIGGAISLSRYAWLAGDLLSAPAVAASIIVLLLQIAFATIMLREGQNTGRGKKLATTWLAVLTATIGAWLWLAYNAWMEHPEGLQINPETGRGEIASLAQIVFSPFTIDKFLHTLFSSWLLGAVFAVSVSSWYLLKKRDAERLMAVKSIKIASVTGLAASVLTAFAGYNSIHTVAKSQPMKMAAMAGLYHGDRAQGLTLAAWINPFEQPDYAAGAEPSLKVELPQMLSIAATGDEWGYVPGVNNIINGGFRLADGTMAISFKEKQQRGRIAMHALNEYRKAKADGRKEAAKMQRSIVNENSRYLGYGYVETAEQTVPYIPLCFWGVRVMAAVGFLLMLFFGALTFVSWHKDIAQRAPIHYHTAILLLPMAFIGSGAGWLAAETGRQPWAIQDMLPTWAAVGSNGATTTMIVFLTSLILLMLVLLKGIINMRNTIKKGGA